MVQQVFEKVFTEHYDSLEMLFEIILLFLFTYYNYFNFCIVFIIIIV